ncbi:hypothetical protein [Microbispora amethystogenes]|uniref:Uncharacterized protein n=1 Tax=Microbispora amethystogenes TaxID=1427754 RepID=A0ABQ4F9L8_9ACTN|nr:hypothetical protein [Microbispora amethystogenes]GIH31517.1 hypothetical protein Mam01_16810 [Microbispora amethystogenes]
MAHEDLVAHYQRLLDVAQFLDVGLSWTVVQSLIEPIGIDDVAALVAGPGFGIEESEVEGDGVFIDDSGPSIMLLDLEGGLFSHYEPSRLERLSAGARVWHLEWTVNGNGALSYAADGRLRLVMPDLRPDDVYGPDPHALDHLLRRLPEPSARLSHARAMSLVELDSGAYLDLDWLNSPQSRVVFPGAE